jgi:hypothetical protein
MLIHYAHSIFLQNLVIVLSLNHRILITISNFIKSIVIIIYKMRSNIEKETLKYLTSIKFGR